MLEYFLYEKNDKYKLYDKEDLNYRKKLSKPLLIEKFSWFFFFTIYFVYLFIYANKHGYLTKEIPAYSIGIILISIIFIINFIVLVFKTYELFKIDSKPEHDGKKALYNIFIIKKWCNLVFQVVLILSIVSYLKGELSSGIFIVGLLALNIFRLLIKLGINKLRMIMIKASLENILSELETLENEMFNIDEYLEGATELEVFFGTRYSATITELNRLLKKVLESTLKEKNSLYSKSQLVSNLSHDLKTPLTSIVNSVYILKNEVLNEEEKIEQIKILEDKTQRLNTLIENLNEVIQSEDNEIILNKERLDLIKIIEDCIQSFSNRFEEANLDIKVNRSNNDIIMLLDKDKTIRVFENLLSNIVKYSLEDTRVYIDIYQDEEGVRVTLKNISKYELEVDKNTLGNRFVKGDKSRHKEGYGLGLSIVKNLVRVQGGKVDIKVVGDLFKVELSFKHKYSTIFND